MHRDTASIIEIGGQNAKYITDFSDRDQSRIQISMNSSCGDGTGAFLEEQAFRLLLALKDFGRYAAKGASIPRIAGRCSVFAKTDITHHLQEGGPLADILLGLAHALVRNYRYFDHGEQTKPSDIIQAPFGRCRQAKLSGGLRRIDGIITLSSNYENTGISPNIVRKEFETSRSKPILNLTFDGNRNDNDLTRIESFLYYP